ncbi:hypothetical protein FACS1894151_01430 [Spirochaetia bacterium]|nr:hypothetical protein FACS1894151_01430 [Spirochaetia bacterium]
MFRRNQAVLSVLLLLAVLPAFSQENAIFVPFVSRLQAEIRGNLIRLTWNDSPDVQGPVYIYRSQAPFDTAHPPSRLLPVEVPYGVQSYIDEMDRSGTWYYCVTASDENGQRIEILIPYTNIVNVTLEIDESDLVLSSLSPFNIPQTGMPDLRRDTDIFSLEAMVQGDGVYVSWATLTGTKTAVLYRSIRPVIQSADLLDAVVAASGIISPFMDYPVPGIPLYYAVIFEEDLVAGNIALFPGRNATTVSVEVPAGPYRVGLPDSSIRAMPLPMLSLSNAASSAGAVPETPAPVSLSADTEKALAALEIPSRLPPALKTSRVFQEDLEASFGGEEYGLRSIVQNSFRKQEWSTAAGELERFLSLHHSEMIENRTHFYLGQSYYYLGRLRESLFEFLLIQSYYPLEAAEWVQAVIARFAQ